VQSPYGPALAHRFLKWIGINEVRVTVGSELIFSDIDINLRTQKAKVVKGTLPPEWLHFVEERGATMLTGKSKNKTAK